jgi:virginiamycin B lyase
MLQWLVLCVVLLGFAAPAHAGAGFVGLYQAPLGANGLSGLSDLLVDTDGTVWFTDRGAGAVGRMTPTGSFTMISLPSGTTPEGLTKTGFGEVVYADPGRGTFGRIMPDGSFAESSTPPETPNAKPTAIVALLTPSFSWWTAGQYYGAMDDFGIWMTSGQQLPGGAVSQGESITYASDGRLWWPTSQGMAALTIINTLAITIYPGPVASSVASGPDGNVWFTEPGLDSVGRITPSGSVVKFPVPTFNAQPVDIVTGPDGNLWFTEAGADQIGRITPSTGAMTEYPVPAGLAPGSITAGRGGLLWFTAIGRHTTDPGSIGYISTGLDATAPSIQLNAPADGAELRAGAPVAVGYTCADEAGGSGVRSCSGSVASGGALDTSRPGPTVLTVSSSDLAGNTSSTTRHYMVAAPPTIDLESPVDGATFIAGATATASFGCSAGAGSSGIDTCSGTVASGARLDTSDPGTHSFAVTAKDHAGTQVTTTHVYTVVARATVSVAGKVATAWRDSRLRGALTLSGSASAAESVQASLVSARGKVAVRYRLKLVAGAFRRRLTLPARLLPGSYAIRVTGIATSGQAARAEVVATTAPARITIPSPSEGLVVRHRVTGQGTQPAVVLHGPQRTLTAHFHFDVLPRGGSAIRVTWYASGGSTPLGYKGAARSRLVTSDVQSSTALPHGAYHAVLSVGGVEVARATIRLT